MFILRHMPENGNASVNTILGKNYQVVRYNGNKKQFALEAEQYWTNPKESQKLYEDGYYAFVVSDTTVIPLKHGHNYIMTDSGKTFENISDFLLPQPSL